MISTLHAPTFLLSGDFPRAYNALGLFSSQISALGCLANSFGQKACSADHPNHYLRCGSTAGGCQPTAHQRRRAATMSAWFIRNATTVARPITLVPSILVPSRLQAK